VTLVDTALVYATSARAAYAETILGRALRRVDGAARLTVATKGGHVRRGDAFVVDGRPEAIREHCERSLHALGLEHVDLYFLHRPDPDVPLAESVGALDELRRAGKIRLVGVSNVSPAQLDVARSAGTVAAVQNRLDGARRDPVLDRCEELGIAYLGYAPFAGDAAAAGSDPAAAAIAAAHGVSPERVVVARHLLSSPVLTVVVGARRPATIRDSAAAAALGLSTAELDALSAPRRWNVSTPEARLPGRRGAETGAPA
jgi:aryl-alcohol dehydrogenase-like predicted oxidoreductase